MNTVYPYIFAILASISSLMSLAAGSDTSSLKNQILAEMESVQTSPDILVVTEERMPSLYGIVSRLAARVQINVPLILIYTGLGDLNSDARSNVLRDNFGMVVIGQNLINTLSAAELEAVIAHELHHISLHHPSVADAAVALTHLAELVSADHEIYEQYLKAYNALLRDCEKQADLGAVDILDNPQAIYDMLDRMQSIVGNDTCPAHPSIEERKKYVAAAIQQKGL